VAGQVANMVGVDLPDEFVDPLDPVQVAAVLTTVRATLDVRGLLDLLARMPGLSVDRGRDGRLLRGSVAASVRGGEDVVRFASPTSREHVVGGVVLNRTTVPPATLTTVLAGMVCDAVRRTDGRDQASAVLTAARDGVSP
jgi:hypothetical protein